jgi:hypothetical protein
MCGFNPLKGGLANPAVGLVPGDPLSSKVVEKTAPKPIKEIATAPLKLMSRTIGEEPTSLLLQGGVNNPATKKQVKSLLGT